MREARGCVGLVVAGKPWSSGNACEGTPWTQSLCCSSLSGFFDALNGRQVPADAPGDARCGVLDRISRQMRIPGGGLHLRVTEQLPDHGQALAQGRRPRSMRRPQVMQPCIRRGPHPAGAGRAVTLAIALGASSPNPVGRTSRQSASSAAPAFNRAAAFRTIPSSLAATPNGRVPPSGVGISTRRDGAARYTERAPEPLPRKAAVRIDHTSLIINMDIGHI